MQREEVHPQPAHREPTHEQPTHEQTTHEQTTPGRAWLASLLLARQNRVMPRFLNAYARLSGMARPFRRRFRRRAAVSLAGAALILAMAGSPLLVPPAHAATITVNETTCTLIDAIRAANTDAAVAGCAAGSGDDVINLQSDVLLTESYGYYYESDTGLPLIDSTITINGNGHTVSRDPDDPDIFRLMAVGSGGDLTLDQVTLSGGAGLIPDLSFGGHGGAIYAAGPLYIDQSALTGNQSLEGNGGAIFQMSGGLTVRRTVISGNETDVFGGGVAIAGGSAAFDHSLIEGNSAIGGGGIFSGEDATTVTIDRTIVRDNHVTGSGVSNGGGLYQRAGDWTITASTISDNTAANSGGGISQRVGYDVPYFNMTIVDSTISGNSAGNNGGGIYTFARTTINIDNSTISGNSAAVGGGIDIGSVIATISDSTITGNTASNTGGGVSHINVFGSSSMARTILSGNTAPRYAELYNAYGTLNANADNVFGRSELTSYQAFRGLPAGASDIVATSDGGDPTPLGDILDTALADNGGPTLTHNLVTGSPAVDLASSGPATDQRGAPRPSGAGFDAGAVEFGSPAPEGNVFMSTTAAGTTADGLGFGPEDIIQWDGGTWTTFFDGSAAGLMPSGNAKHDINAFWIPDPSGDDVVMSFAQNARLVPGIMPKVDGMDLVEWNGSAFSLYFDGSDVGLTVKTSEKIDALHILPGSESPIGGSCDAYLLVSTSGAGKVPNFGGGTLNFRGEDVLGFCATNLGATTAGFWHMVLDGSAEGMPANATDSISLSADGNVLHLTTKGTFVVDDAVGGHSMIYEYNMTTTEFSGPTFIAADNGLPKKVDGLQVE